VGKGLPIVIGLFLSCIKPIVVGIVHWVYCIVSAAMIGYLRGAHSSAEERYVDIVEVIGSIPIAPTKTKPVKKTL
jgi:hypothetical protein